MQRCDWALCGLAQGQSLRHCNFYNHSNPRIGSHTHACIVSSLRQLVAGLCAGLISDIVFGLFIT